MSARLASVPLSNTSIRASTDLQAAFALFNRVSGEITDSYRLLERRVEELSSELEQVDRARLRELEEKEQLSERLQSLLDLLPGGVIVLDSCGVVCECNPAARDMLQSNPIGERWLDVITRCFAPRVDDGHEISLASGRRVGVATRSLERDFGQVVLLTDQTETRDLQDRLSRHQRLNAMGRMMAALAHQIRTPLSAAMLYASNLCEGELSVEQTRRFSTRILARLTHLEHQVRDMLIFVRDDVKLEHCISASELVEHIGSAMEMVLATHAATCDVRIDCDPQLRLRCNRDALVGAILNLVNNGLQAAGDGTRLGLSLVRREQSLCISVCDNGPGMSAETLSRLSDDFFTTKAQGTGLGIAVVRSVARAHRGELELRSVPKQGTCATLVLPLAAENTGGGDAGA